MNTTNHSNNIIKNDPRIQKYLYSEQYDMQNLKTLVKTFEEMFYEDEFSSNYERITELLRKYYNKNFFLTFHYHPASIPSKMEPCNWSLHTEDELDKILPKGIPINYLLLDNISLNMRKNFFKEIPFHTVNDNTKNSKWINILTNNSNLHIIHPTFLKFAQYFLSSQK